MADSPEQNPPSSKPPTQDYLWRVGAYLTPFVYAGWLMLWPHSLPAWLVILAAISVLSLFVTAGLLQIRDMGGWARLESHIRRYLLPSIAAIVIICCLIVGTGIYLTVRPPHVKTTAHNAPPSTPAPDKPEPPPTDAPKGIVSPNVKPPHSRPREQPPEKPSVPPYDRVEVPICPPDMQVFHVSESTVSDNGGCGYTSLTPACVIVENHSFIQRNTGGGVCIGPTLKPKASPSGVKMDGMALGMGRMVDGKCSLVLYNVDIEGFNDGLSTVGPDGACIDIEKSTIQGNGTGVNGEHLPAPSPH
jgi:hypothetical protein